jgi:hypothetical protein
VNQKRDPFDATRIKDAARQDKRLEQIGTEFGIELASLARIRYRARKG